MLPDKKDKLIYRPILLIPKIMKKHFLCSLLLLFFCLIIVPIAHSMAFAGNVKSEQRIKARKNPRAVVDLVDRIGGKGQNATIVKDLDI